MSAIGVVIPAYQPRIPRLIDYISRLDSELEPELIRVEIDGPLRAADVESIRTTGAVVNAVDARRGKGAAITDGFEALPSDIDVYLTVDADGSTLPESAEAIVDPVITDTADLAVGSRRHPDSVVRNHQTIVRRRLGTLFTWIARMTLPIRLFDYQCGGKAISAAGWKRVRPHLYETGFGWDIELVSVAAVLGLTVREIPITWEDQPGSTVNVLDVLDLARSVIVVHHRHKVLQGHPIHSRFPFRANDEVITDHCR